MGMRSSTRLRSDTRVEWLGEGQRRGGIVGFGRAVRRVLVGVWRWGRWLAVVLLTPFVLIGYWWGMLTTFGVVCLFLVCIGKWKAARDAMRMIPLVPRNLRGLLVPPRTELARRALRFVTRWW
jgi:hypothetical protein